MRYLALFACLLALPTLAQVRIADQKGKPYYDRVLKLCAGKLPAQDALATMQASPLPTAFADTLLKYDWAEIGSYFFNEKAYRDELAQEQSNQSQYKLFRVMPDGKVADFSLSRNTKGAIEITTTAFDKNTAISYLFKKVGVHNCIEVEAYGEKSYITIISFKNGTLVLDSPKSGKEGSNEATRFRNVYQAIPRGFKWDWK